MGTYRAAIIALGFVGPADKVSGHSLGRRGAWVELPLAGADREMTVRSG
jgi:hypothetical protein